MTWVWLLLLGTGRGGDEKENGNARDVIYRGAQKLVPDVLVMGRHGYSLIKRKWKVYGKE